MPDEQNEQMCECLPSGCNEFSNLQSKHTVKQTVHAKWMNCKKGKVLKTYATVCLIPRVNSISFLKVCSRDFLEKTRTHIQQTVSHTYTQRHDMLLSQTR